MGITSSSYKAEYQLFKQNPNDFWLEKSQDISWFKKPVTGVSERAPGLYDWFADGELNNCYLALDHHVAQGRGDQLALIYDSPVTQTQQKFTYLELTTRVAKFAGALEDLGVTKGDRVVIYLPMIPEAVVGMLACARIGAIHSVVFGGFAAHELAIRIDDAKPKVILSASCGIEGEKLIPYKPLLDSAIGMATHKVQHAIILQRPQQLAIMKSGFDLDWSTLEAIGNESLPVALKSTDPLYVLYTSGTTGKPKGVVRDNGGHAVAMRYSMEYVYGLKPGDVFWAASDVGWVVGHSYIVYAPLITGCTTILYEGKPVRTPDAGSFWRVISEHRVNALFTAPTAFRAIRKEDPQAELLAQYDISSLKRIFLAGERLDPPTYHWLTDKTGIPVLDHWWQTETGWAVCCNPVGIETLAIKAGSSTVPVPGYQIDIINTHGEICKPDEQGAVCIKLPLPPGCLPTVWGDDQRYRSSYLKSYPGYYLTGDGGYFDEDGYLFIMGRTDDVINVAGHRLSTGEMEEILAAHPSVAECAVFGINDQLKGELPVGMVVLKDGVERDIEAIEKELIATVRDKIGAVACFNRAIIVDRLPKTRSGKILRRTLRQMMNGESYQVPSTIDDPAILDEILSTIDTRNL